MAATRRRNTFTKAGGATYVCDVCGRLTRHTGAQGYGSKLCPYCWDLAGLENELSDGYATPAERKSAVLELTTKITAKGGTLGEWADLLARVNA